MVRILMHGYRGKMGQAICQLAAHDPDYAVVAGIDVLSDADGLAFPTYARIADCDMPADVVIDFSTAVAVPALIDYAVKRGIPTVIGTTALSGECLSQIQKAAEKIAVFQSPNMSLGINLLAKLLEKAAVILDEANFDIEIVEKHHNQKIDAPSGTALLLADAVNHALGDQLELVTDRTGLTRKRTRRELGMHAVRGGTIVGEHSVIFAGQDEVIEFNHSARSKQVFAVGALKAAKFLKGRPPGMYGMRDIMNEL